jgi:hypothetical protein
MRRTVHGSLSVAFLAAVSGCTSQSVTGSQVTDPTEKAAKTASIVPDADDGRQAGGEPFALFPIDRPGGVLELDDTARIEIPGDTVTAPTDVFLAVDRTPTAADADQEGEVPIGPALLLAPDLRAPPDRKIAVSIPCNRLPYGCDCDRFFLVNGRIDWCGAAAGERTVSYDRTYWRARAFGNRLIALLDGIQGMQLQFVAFR